MVPYVDIIGLCHSVVILREIFVAALPFQAHANYGTITPCTFLWSNFSSFRNKVGN